MADDRNTILLGGGGHARVLIDALRKCGIEPHGLSDPALEAGSPGPLGVPVIGDDEAVLALDSGDVMLVNGIGSVGDTRTRREVFERFRERKYEFLTVIHPAAVIGGRVMLGEGAQVMAGAVIQTGTQIGDNTIVNTCASIDHDCKIGAGVHIAPGAVLSGHVSIADGVHIGTGVKVMQGINIGARSVIGVGVAVLRDVPPGMVVHPASTPVWTGA